MPEFLRENNLPGVSMSLHYYGADTDFAVPMKPGAQLSSSDDFTNTGTDPHINAGDVIELGEVL
jgi:hypothetical protein